MNVMECIPHVAAPTLQKCLAAAVRAPSGDNTQPWRFETDDSAGRISVFIDETRDSSPMNCGQTMSRMACGAAVENILIQAAADGWAASVEEGFGNHVATIQLDQESPLSPVTRQTLNAIYNRVSNRRLYDARPVDPLVLSTLNESTPLLDDVRTHWCTERSRINTLAPIIGAADGILFGESSMRNAFLANVRFDRPVNEEVDSGLSLASLELSLPDRAAMRMMSHIPSVVLKATGASRLFNLHARKLIKSASGVCAISVPEAHTSYFQAGRALQRAWLVLTELGFAVQPMMSLMVLLNALHHGSSQLKVALGTKRIIELAAQFDTAIPEFTCRKPLFLLRFGYAKSPSGRTGRLQP